MKKWNIQKLIAGLKNLPEKIKKNPKKFIYTSLMVFFVAVFLFCTGFLVVYYINSNKQAKQNDKLADIVDQVQQEMNNNGTNNIINSDGTLNVDPENPLLNNNNVYMEVVNPKNGEYQNVLREYSTVFLMNPDMVGWIKIPGTKVNYPVLQNMDEINYYLKRDFYGQSARHGSIYAHEMADFNAPSDNITLYGHNMADGTMFAGLHAYEDPEFYKEHPYILFDTLTSHQIYKIVAVFYTTDDPIKGFPYHEFTDGDEHEFNLFVEECKSLSMYDTGVNPVYGNKLLTLSTCDHDIFDDHGRFVVVAMKISL